MADAVFRQLAALTRAVAGSRTLERVLSGADIPSSVKRTLLDDVTKHAYDPAALDSAIDAIASSDATAAHALAATSTLRAFKSADDVAALETALYSIGSLINENVELRQALSDFAVLDASKAAMLAQLLAGKTDETAIELAITYIYLDHGRGVSDRLIEAARLGAEQRNTLIADVRTAVEIDEARRKSLTAALKSNFGQEVLARFSVDPTIIGSVVVRIGDEVLDGSVRHRLEQARKAMAS